MRKIVVSQYLTLDGVFEDPSQWSFDFWNNQAEQFKRDELFSAEIQLMGRRTYQTYARVWPSMNNDDIGRRMNSMPKYVASTTLTSSNWNNTTIISDNTVDEIQRLKSQGDGTILVTGSGQLVKVLMLNKLVDDFYALIHPIVLGHGRQMPLEKFPLQLIDQQVFHTGIILAHYHLKG